MKSIFNFITGTVLTTVVYFLGGLDVALKTDVYKRQHLYRDNWVIGVKETIGADRGIVIKYGKNSTEMCIRDRGRHGSEKWANRTTFTEATDLFIIRAIPGTKLSTDMTILCDDENFEITSIEDVKGKNMYIEILAKKVTQNG